MEGTDFFHHSLFTRSTKMFLIYFEAELNTTTTIPSSCLPPYYYLFNDNHNNKGDTFTFFYLAQTG